MSFNFMVAIIICSDFGTQKNKVSQLAFSQFSHSVVSSSLQSHEPRHARPPCPSPTPRVHPNPCPLSPVSTVSPSICHEGTMPKLFDCVDHNNLWKILKEMGIPDHLTCLLRNLYAGQEATVRTRHEQQTGSKLGKEYVKAVYCHPAYLISMQST